MNFRLHPQSPTSSVLTDQKSTVQILRALHVYTIENDLNDLKFLKMTSLKLLDTQTHLESFQII